MDELESLHKSAHAHEDSHPLTWADRARTIFFPDSRKLPGTLVSGFCKSGLSASEDTDHISGMRRMGGLSTQQGWRTGGERGRHGGNRVWRSCWANTYCRWSNLEALHWQTAHNHWLLFEDRNGYIDVHDDMFFCCNYITQFHHSTAQHSKWFGW